MSFMVVASVIMLGGLFRRFPDARVNPIQAIHGR